MSSETPTASNLNAPESSIEERQRLEDAGHTPVPSENGPDGKQNAEPVPEAVPVPASGDRQGAGGEATDLTGTAVDTKQPAPPATQTETTFALNSRGDGMNQQQQHQQQQLPLSLNKLAIYASAQNKLPVNKVKGIVVRLGRHTESTIQKSGKWYKNDGYVDKDTYTWRNMPLFEDHQTHMWTNQGTVRGSCKK